MNLDSLEIYLCPHCRASKFVPPVNLTGGDKSLQDGILTCLNCHSETSVISGIPQFLHDMPSRMVDEITSSEGVATYCCPREPEVYSDEWLLSLPYVTNPKTDNYVGWKRKVPYFEQALELLPPTDQGLTLLELGASTTWATRYFARHGYDCYALDIVRGKYRGLESREVYFQAENVYYEALIASMENIPFVDASLDRVFSINSLHHCENLEETFREIYRILRPSGFAVLIDDAVGHANYRKKLVEAEKNFAENKHNDHVYLMSDYKSAISNAGLLMESIIPKLYQRHFASRYLPSFLWPACYRAISWIRGGGFVLKVTKP